MSSMSTEEEKSQVQYRLIGKKSFLPVISLEFVSIGQAEVLLAGEGPYLKVLTRDGQLLATEEVLPFRRVHGIRPAPFWVHSPNSEKLILVFGQKGMRVLTLQVHDHKYSLSSVSAVMEAPDWILDVCWLNFGDSTNFFLAYITAHNAVSLYRVINGVASTNTAHSEVNCILYSARLYMDAGDSITVLSGTVFNHILLWTVDMVGSCDPSVRAPVRLTLTGHEGVIFSIRLSTDHTSLISVSDDRTVRVWPLPQDWKLVQGAEQSGSSLVLYGHTARVWDARLLPKAIVSVGEDAVCRVWGKDGHLVRCEEGHSGRSVWSVAVDADYKTVATGGGDCSIRVFSLEDTSTRERKWAWHTTLPSKDLPRSVCLHGNTAICHSNDGYLYSAEMMDGSMSPVWREVVRDSTFTSYCVLALSAHTLALGNLEGLVKVLQLEDQGAVSVETSWRAHTGKVFSLTWSEGDPQLLLSCGPDGDVVCWRCHCDKNQGLTVVQLARLELPPSKHRWTSAALVVRDSEFYDPTADRGVSLTTSKGSVASSPGLFSFGDSLDTEENYTVVVGDRKGSLHVYKVQLISAEKQSPAVQPSCTIRAHGPNGLTCVKLWRGSVYSAGRNGYCRKYRLNRDGSLTELTKFKPVKGMDWIENVFFVNDDTLVFGFHTTDMILYSTAQSKYLAKINCGGGHRSYGINSLQEILRTRSLRTVYIKQSSLCLTTSPLDDYFTRSILQPGFVGKEAISMEILEADSKNGDLLLAVGSEDCTVCLVTLSAQHSTLNVIKILTGHLSSVKALSCSQCTHNKEDTVLFSGGARASLKAWMVPPARSLLDQLEDVSLLSEVFLHDKQGRRRQRIRDELPECRVMSLASFPLSQDPMHYVAAGCSDGLIRQYLFDEERCSFQPQPPLEYHDRCILCVKCFIFEPPDNLPSTPLLFSAATDSQVCVWSLASQIEGAALDQPPVSAGTTLHPVARKEEGGTGQQPVTVCKAHQSGINDLAVRCQGDQLCVVSVGDDNAVTVSTLRVEVRPHLSITVTSQHSHLTAHSSSITGVDWVRDGLLATTSIDQRLCIWSTGLIGSLSLVTSFTHDVADVAALRTHSTSESTTVVFCGVGLQYYHLQPN